MTERTTSIAASAIRRIVIRAPNWLGDAVMALPAMASVRSALPHTTIAVAAIPAVAPMFLEGTGLSPDEILTIDRHTEATQLAAGAFDAALLLPNSFRTAWNARRAGIPQRWGYAGGFRGWTLDKAVGRPRQPVHQAMFYQALTEALGYPTVDQSPRISARAETRDRAAVLFREHGITGDVPVVGVAPGAAYGHAKRWPPRRVGELIGRLTRERGATCVLVGAAGDRGAGREIESALPPATAVANLIGRTDLRLLIGVLARCVAFVSNDSGAMHLAAATGLPVTAIFGPTDERVTAPVGHHDVLVHPVFCRPCMLRECPIDHRCMNGISVDAVYASVTGHLAARALDGSHSQ